MIHDPCIVAVPDEGLYYAYGSDRGRRQGEGRERGPAGVLYYTSSDLITWTGPQRCFTIPEDTWADRTANPWAPEVHAYRGRFYLFATLHNRRKPLPAVEGRDYLHQRGTQIFVSDKASGPFEPISGRNAPHTPLEEMALDGTLHVDQQGQPWMVYCQEWLQAGEGLFKAVRLTADLAAPVGQPVTLMNAADVGWTKKQLEYREQPITGAVSDGPWLHRTPNGVLQMLWSSWSPNRDYCLAIATSGSGTIHGPWQNTPEPALADDRGHGMLFRTLDGQMRLALHRYFHFPDTRVQIWGVSEDAAGLQIEAQLLGAE